MPLSRRSLITGLISLVAAPAIVRAGSLMPVKAMEAMPGPSELLFNEWAEATRGPFRPEWEPTIVFSHPIPLLKIGDMISWSGRQAKIIAKVSGSHENTYLLNR